MSTVTLPPTSDDVRLPCTDVDAEAWFPDHYRDTGDPVDPPYLPDVADLIETCRVCPVVAECLMEALAVEDGAPVDMRFGVRGGTDPIDRWLIDQEWSGETPKPSKPKTTTRRRPRIYGQPMQPAAPLAEALRDLMVETRTPAGVFYAQVSAATGISRDAVGDITLGQRIKVHKATHDKLTAYLAAAETSPA